MKQDQDLLERARCMDPEILAEVYDTFSPGLYAYAIRRLNDPCQAEECVAHVFSGLLEAFYKGAGPRQQLRAYLYRSAHNWIIDQYRRRPELALAETFIADTRQNPAAAAQASLDGQALKKALGELTEDQRRVVLLRYLDGLSHQEVAQVLEKPIGAVKSLHQRALAALQRKLDPQLDDDGFTVPSKQKELVL